MTELVKQILQKITRKELRELIEQRTGRKCYAVYINRWLGDYVPNREYRGVLRDIQRTVND
jgi:hypothetical protein